MSRSARAWANSAATSRCSSRRIICRAERLQGLHLVFSQRSGRMIQDAERSHGKSIWGHQRYASVKTHVVRGRGSTAAHKALVQASVRNHQNVRAEDSVSTERDFAAGFCGLKPSLDLNH